MPELQATITESIPQLDNVALFRYFKEHKSFGAITITFQNGEIVLLEPRLTIQIPKFKKSELPKIKGVIETK